MATTHRTALIGLLTTAFVGACMKPSSESAPVKVDSVHAALSGDNGLRLNGLRLNGLRLNGLRLNGLRLNGLRLNGLRLNGLRLNGLDIDGLQLVGTNVSGLTHGGVSLHDVMFNSWDSAAGAEHVNSMALDGLTDTDAIDYPHDLASLAFLDGTQLTEAETNSVLLMLEEVVHCAVPANVQVLFRAADGSDLYLPSDPNKVATNAGHDPGWVSNAPDLTRSPDVANCVLQNNPTITHEPVTRDRFLTLFKYQTECALDATDFVDVELEDGTLRRFHGSFGLAPWWNNHSLNPAPADIATEHGDDVGERRLSACLAARVNALGENVLLSFRGTTVRGGNGLALDAGESDAYPVREAAFWGNFYGDSPVVHTCHGEGELLSRGRVCALQAEKCGFEPTFNCPDVDDSESDIGTASCSGVRGDTARAVEKCTVEHPTQGVLNEGEVVTTYIIRGNCGNGIVDHPEQCDDGNAENGDGCNIGCKLEVCGDGIVNNNGREQCDDGNDVTDDGCYQCQWEEICGDGRIVGFERCDDGNTEDGDGCNSLCQLEYCGDSEVNNDGQEECDDGNDINGDGCTTQCVQEYCGDGIVNNSGFELCDDGNAENGDGCDSTCQPEPVCGDGIKAESEDCDDSNTEDGDGCSSECLTEDALCGNDVLEEGEDCDDGNLVDGDGCSAFCTLEEE